MTVNFCPEWLNHRNKIPQHVVKAIEDFVRKVLEKFPDAEVYLFGSYATGTWLEDSDIDLIVVSDNLKNIKFLERLSLLRRLASPELSFEILAYTRDELRKKLKEVSIVQEASRYWIRINC